MKRTVITVLATATLVAVASAQEGTAYQLKLHELKPGELVVHKSFSDSQKGRMTVTRGAVVQKGSLSITRTRLLERRLIGSGPKAQLQYKIVSDQTTTLTELAGKQETDVVSGALVGKTVFGFRDAMRHWRLFALAVKLL